jgi:hypothetical protein
VKRTPLVRRTPLRARRKGAAYNRLRALVHAREGGSCARCGTHTPITEGHCHHRLLRAQGGLDDAWNCVWLCGMCHGYVHASPAESYCHGWLVPMGADPAAWPTRCAWPAPRQGVRGGYRQPGPDGWAPALPSDRQVEAA